ncbi:ankyrin repeat domain-containing protein, partial [Lactococcus petauri]|uniref:ankyrin repeat domain-containing protein n=1 Tax=Lactococcus petauri TaxID=1940789 RepID=UPI0034DB1271
MNAQKEPDLCTPLHLAISQCFKVTMEAILAFHPNIYLLDSENRSVLHYAVLSRQDILESLLQVPNIRQLISVRNKKKRN